MTNVKMRPDGWPCGCCEGGCQICGDTDCRSARHREWSSEPPCRGRGVATCEECDAATATVEMDGNRLCVDCSLQYEWPDEATLREAPLSMVELMGGRS